METTDKNQLSLLTIVKAIQSVTGVDIRVKTRKRDIIYLKKIYIKIAKDSTKLSLQKIGKFIKINNHATILHHLNNEHHGVNTLLETDEFYKEIYSKVIAILVKKSGTKSFISKDQKVIYCVKTLEKKEVVYVDRVVDYHDTGIPKYIIEHLMGYTEEQLKNLYETRLIPFSKMMI
jgi:hypothetical protein